MFYNFYLIFTPVFFLFFCQATSNFNLFIDIVISHFKFKAPDGTKNVGKLLLRNEESFNVYSDVLCVGCRL